MDSVSLDIIPDNILQALDFHLSLLSYLKERALRFVDVTDNLDLKIEPIDNSQPITDSEDEKVRKLNKCVAKRKTQLNNLCTPVRALITGSAAVLLSCPALLSCLGSSAPLSSFSGSPTYLSSLATCL